MTAPSDSPPCPSDEQLSAFADGAGDRASLVPHLEGCANCRRAVAALVAARSGLSLTAASPEGPGTAGATHLEPGTLLGRYVVMHLLGEGGMGSVWAAWDPELHRRVALKLLHVADPTAQARLQREAQALARLSHPNVVSVYDLGSYRAQSYVALELVEGQTLAAWQPGRPWQEVLRAYLDAGAGLAAVQAAGILHRDFKPQNVLIDAGGRVRVTDFGLARLEVAAAESPAPGLAPPESPVLSQAGLVLGTPAYMAPEQLLGREVDARADQFSFCASLYEGLFGQRPFAPRELKELEALHAAGPRAPPATARAPAWLTRAVLRGLAFEPDARFPTLAALLSALQPRSRARAPLAFAALGLVALTGAGAWGWWRTHLCTGAEAQLAGVWDAPARGALAAKLGGLPRPWAADVARLTAAALDRYAAAWVAMHTEACEATRVRGDQSDLHLSLRMACLQQRKAELGALASLLSQADPAVAEKAAAAASSLPSLSRCADLAALSAPTPRPDDPKARAEADAIDVALAALKAKLATGQYAAGREDAKQAEARAAALAFAPLQAQAGWLRGQFEERLGGYKAAEDLYSQASLAAELGNDAPSLAEARVRLVWVTGFYQAKKDVAEQWARQAEVAVKKAGSPKELEGGLQEALGALAMSQGQYADAQTHYEGALAAWTACFGADDARTLRVLGNLAGAWLARGEHQKAAATYRSLIEATERAFGPHHPNIGRVSINLASALVDTGDLPAALAAAERGVALCTEALGEAHADTGAAHLNRGAVLRRMGRHDEALAAYRKALAVFEAAFGPVHPRVASALNSVGTVLLIKGQAEEAEQLFSRALEIQLKVNRPDHPDVAWAWMNLGNARATRHHLAEALEAHRKALEIREKAYGPSHTNVAGSLTTIGDDLANLGRCKEALPLFERAQAIREKVLGPTHEELAWSLVGLGRCRLELGLPAAALEPLERALAVRAASQHEGDRAVPKWLLGRALWETGKDRARAKALVTEAAASFDGDSADDRAAAQQWLKKH